MDGLSVSFVVLECHIAKEEELIKGSSAIVSSSQCRIDPGSSHDLGLTLL